MRPRRLLFAGLAVLLLVVAGIAGYRQLVRPPRPDLPLPTGQSLRAVRGNCESGGELVGCTPGSGPRSFLTISAGAPRQGAEALFAALKEHGWREEARGATARDYAGGGAPEDLQPVYCKDGCVGLFRFETDGYVLAWFEG